MKTNTIPIPEGYDGRTQRMVALFAWQLDDQFSRLRKSLDGLTISQLEWQLHPGMNTIGMLLAHIAVAEVFWMQVAPKEIPAKTEGDEIIKRLIGIGGNEDGLPLPPGGTHPATLSGKSLDDYLSMLDTCRAATRAVLRTWTDDDLGLTYTLEDYTISLSWTLHHILEHLVVHRGQILLLKHLMRDKGILAS